MITSPTYDDIARDYGLWMQYADPHGITNEDEFDTLTLGEKMEFLILCFGPEVEAQIHG